MTEYFAKKIWLYGFFVLNLHNKTYNTIRVLFEQ
jgi:hypothetical protein